MTLEEVEAEVSRRTDLIRAAVAEGDTAGAHMLRDELWRFVLEHCRDQGHPLAAKALDLPDFRRRGEGRRADGGPSGSPRD
ncbi:hypothetical protein [Streptomyces indicus]|uniref:Uncharacterized protein n=1 Tax=Streptomyces indicus TaxID=417292 RepID=A0A1G9A2B0_9ACTN|nr:hypothetical protein [Streptomyces indicus]SDK21387.1 hypothetical protein SAMN05421806_105324 [Streptomyces indicus]